MLNKPPNKLYLAIHIVEGAQASVVTAAHLNTLGLGLRHWGAFRYLGLVGISRVLPSPQRRRRTQRREVPPIACHPRRPLKKKTGTMMTALARPPGEPTSAEASIYPTCLYSSQCLHLLLAFCYSARRVHTAIAFSVLSSWLHAAPTLIIRAGPFPTQRRRVQSMACRCRFSTHTISCHLRDRCAQLPTQKLPV